MKLENQVTSLEISQRLKELGVKQESLFWWNTWGNSLGNPFITQSKSGLVDDMTPYLASAFTVAELGEMLPKDFYTEKSNTKPWRALDMRLKKTDGSEGDCARPQFAATEADARGAMLIYLLENKLILLPNHS